MESRGGLRKAALRYRHHVPRCACTSHRPRRYRGVSRKLDQPEPVTSLAVFACAAFLEIAGCFAFWAWLRKGASGGVAVLGVLSLVAFAALLTRADAAFAGRAYAAYGGIYIAASLVWLWGVEGQAPRASDLIGAGLAIIGAAVIVSFAGRAGD